MAKNKQQQSNGDGMWWKVLIVIISLIFLVLFYMSQSPPEIIEEDVETDRYIGILANELYIQEEILCQYYYEALDQCLEDIDCTAEERSIVENLIEQSLNMQKLINGTWRS